MVERVGSKLPTLRNYIIANQVLPITPLPDAAFTAHRPHHLAQQIDEARQQIIAVPLQ